MNVRWLPLAALACCAHLAHAAEEKHAIPPPATESLPEVEIDAQREKLTVMRAEMEKLEDQFYAEYNKLNTDHQYDVSCHWEAPTGTILKQRVCMAAFVSRATEDEARGFLDGHPAPPASMVVGAKLTDYRKNMVDVVSKHPELIKLLKQRVDLGHRYEAIRKEKHKDKVFVWD